MASTAWRACVPEDGSDVYYFNLDTGDTSWGVPAGMDAAAIPEFGVEDEVAAGTRDVDNAGADGEHGAAGSAGDAGAAAVAIAVEKTPETRCVCVCVRVCVSLSLCLSVSLSLCSCVPPSPARHLQCVAHTQTPQVQYFVATVTTRRQGSRRVCVV